MERLAISPTITAEIPPQLFRVLVFPSANEPGLEIIRSLARSNKVELFGGSSYEVEYDPSRPLLRNHLRCPALGEPGFRDELERLLRENEINVLFPTVDAVVAEVASWKLSDVAVIAPSPETARVLLSKRATYRALKGAASVPSVFDNGEVPLPAFAKPDEGSGSTGAIELRTEADLVRARDQSLLVHQNLPGAEYTVDCLGNPDGKLLVANVRLRARVSRGMSLATEMVERPQIRDQVTAIAETMPIAGPWFAQFKEDAEGNPILLEVNGRVAGSMTLTRLAGINIPLAALFLFNGVPIRIPPLIGSIRINRSLRTVGELSDFDWILWDLEDTLVRPDGKPDPEVVGRLHDFDNQGMTQLLVTKHADPHGLLERAGIPVLFAEVRSVEDKPAELAAVLADHGIDARRCVLINDSITENLQIAHRHPELRTIRPDCLDVLAREAVE